MLYDCCVYQNAVMALCTVAITLIIVLIIMLIVLFITMLSTVQNIKLIIMHKTKLTLMLIITPYMLLRIIVIHIIMVNMYRL